MIAEFASPPPLGRLLPGGTLRGPTAYLIAIMTFAMMIVAAAGLALSNAAASVGQAVENRYVEELGGMNIFFVMDDGSLRTPPLGGTILPGITRASVIALAEAKGIKVEQTPYSFEEWQKDAASGRVRETFACGTAAVLAGIGLVRHADGEFAIGDGQVGALTTTLRDELVSIQRGGSNDAQGWVHPVDVQ